MTYFVVSDVHSFYDEMLKALEDKGFDINNPEHIIINCGDALDRGSKPFEVLDFFMNKLPKGRRILIRGNHEDLMEEALARGYFMVHDIHNGTQQTAFKLTNSQDLNEFDAIQNMKKHQLYNKYVSECVDFREIGDYIFVHGWIPCKPYVYKYQEDWREGDWKSARWYNGMEMWHKGVREPNKTIVCGHWHSSFGNCYYHQDGLEFPNKFNKGKANFKPFIDEGIVALDACTALSHFVNCLKIEV